MNGKARMSLAMQRKKADRVPVMCQLALGHYFLNCKDRWKPHEIWFTTEAFVDSVVALCKHYRFDGILLNIPGRDPDWANGVESIVDTARGEQITLKDGKHILVPWDDNPQFEHTRPDRFLAPDFMTFDPDKDFDHLSDYSRYTWGIYHTPNLPGTGSGLLVEPPDYFFRTIDLAREYVGDSVSIHGEVFSPFTHFMELFGYQNALTGLILDAKKAEAILERLVTPAVAWAVAQAGRGVDAVLISSAFAGGGFISQDMYRRFVLPFERSVVNAVHGAFPDTPVYTHTCGKLGDRLELLLETHTDGIDTLDPPPLGNVELADAKRRIGDKLFIKGNINSVAILDDSEEQFIARATKTLDAGKPNGGYILSTACSVAPHVEPWKLELLTDLAERNGRYSEYD
jgi:hypothetical protein